MLRPGGDLVISDVHHELITRGSVMTARGPAGEPRIAPTHRHQTGDYLRAALRHGLQVRRCEEPRAASPDEPLPEPAAEIGDWATGRGRCGATCHRPDGPRAAARTWSSGTFSGLLAKGG